MSAALSYRPERPAGHSLEGRAPVAMHITTIALVLFVEFEARQRGTIPVRGGGTQLFGLEAASRHVFRCHKVSAVRPRARDCGQVQHECMAGDMSNVGFAISSVPSNDNSPNSASRRVL